MGAGLKKSIFSFGTDGSLPIYFFLTNFLIIYSDLKINQLNMFILLCFISIGYSIHINKHGNFVDDVKCSIYIKTGAIRVFHGFNVVYKPAPYFPITDHFDVMTSFSEEDC